MFALFLARNSCKGYMLKSLQNKLFTPQMQRFTPSVSNRSLVGVSRDPPPAEPDHSRIWTAEKFLSASLIGLLPAGIAFPNPALDYALAVALTVHVHWGIEAIVVDYARPSVIGATLSRAALASVYALTVFTLGGLFYFNYSDVGLCQAIRMLWKL